VFIASVVLRVIVRSSASHPRNEAARSRTQSVRLCAAPSPFRRLLGCAMVRAGVLSVVTAAGAADAPYVFTLNGAPNTCCCREHFVRP